MRVQLDDVITTYAQLEDVFRTTLFDGEAFDECRWRIVRLSAEGGFSIRVWRGNRFGEARITEPEFLWAARDPRELAKLLYDCGWMALGRTGLVRPEAYPPPRRTNRIRTRGARRLMLAKDRRATPSRWRKFGRSA